MLRIFNFLFKPTKAEDGTSSFKFTLRARIITLWLASGIALVFFFYFSRILPVFIWAAITAYLFNPIVSYFTSKVKAPRAVWIIALYIVLGILIFLLFRSMVPLISLEISDLASGSLDDPSTFLGRIASQKNTSLFGVVINWKAQVQTFSDWIKDQIPMLAVPIFFGTVGKLIFLLIYFVVSFYFLLESGNYVDRFKEIIPLPYKTEISSLLERVNSTLGAYIRAQVILIIIMTLASFTILTLLSVKYALVISITTGVLEVIPIAGPICATVIAATVALFQVGTPFAISNVSLAVLVIVAYFALRQFEDYFIIPNIVSRFVKVHPVVAIFSLMVGGAVGGVLGLFLAIPTAAILKVLFGYIYQKLIEA
jgi:predicted PurR-regulated permease PerM